MTEIKPPTIGVWAVAATFRSPDGAQDAHVVDVVPGTNQANALAGFVAGFIQATKLDWALATTACAPVSEAWLQSALSVLRGGSDGKVVSLREVEPATMPTRAEIDDVAARAGRALFPGVDPRMVRRAG